MHPAMRLRKVCAVLAVAAACVALPRPAGARGPLGANAHPVIFVVSKSENRNQVHYAVRLDDQCVPEGERPVRAFWRMLERGPGVTEPLLPREKRIYGVGRQVVERGERGGDVALTLRALPDRPVRVEARTVDGKCTVRAVSTVSGAPSVLRRVHAVLGLFSVKRIRIEGTRLGDGARLTEVVRP